MNLPSNINVNGARLPEVYEHAKTALANCASIDECKDWGDKAAALASYARQADDDTLEKMAMRIRARAVRRCGELLKQFDGRPNNARKQTEGDHSLISQRQAAAEAGMSEYQQFQSLRVANVPDDEFNDSVESDKPPTISQLVIMARNKPEKVEAQLRLPGYEHLQSYYVVRRDGDDIGVHVADLTDKELEAKCDLYRTMAASCYAHADELDRYRRLRKGQHETNDTRA